MTAFILAMALLVIMAGLVLVLRPGLLFGFLAQNRDRMSIYLSAIAVRALLGLVLIDQAAGSKYPVPIEIFGWLLLLVALFLVALGRSRFAAMIDKMIAVFGPFARVAGVVTTILGALLAYAFI